MLFAGVRLVLGTLGTMEHGEAGKFASMFERNGGFTVGSAYHVRTSRRLVFAS